MARKIGVKLRLYKWPFGEWDFPAQKAEIYPKKNYPGVPHNLSAGWETKFMGGKQVVTEKKN